jgi:hypothetical protein
MEWAPPRIKAIEKYMLCRVPITDQTKSGLVTKSPKILER